MASTEPSEDDVRRVLEFASLDHVRDRKMVIHALKDNGGNIESVVSQFFDNADNFRQKYSQLWNEDMFSADRDGTDNHTGISFHIESLGQSDVIEGMNSTHESYGPGAPSRPPSRSNNRSPSGKVVDWNVGEDGPARSNSRSREDEDMQRALRESAQEAGIALPDQEPDMLRTMNPISSFGPATRHEYDQDVWAMVPTETDASKAPAPEDRKRPSGTPAFLVQGHCSSGEHRLGGLLTILHRIPLSRNILLQTGTPAASYGFNTEWWKGQEILPPQVLAQLQTGELNWAERHGSAPSCEEEIHRLMAFLDSTERSYGTVSVLADLIPSQPDDEDEDMDATFGLLEIKDMETGEDDSARTLYETLDRIMWSDAFAVDEGQDPKMAMFKEMGEVLPLKIGADAVGPSLEIPLEFYPERYLESRMSEARRIQQGLRDAIIEVDAIAKAKRRVTAWREEDWDHPFRNDALDMITTLSLRWTLYQEYLEGRGRFRAMEAAGFNNDRFPDYLSAPSELNEEERRVSGNVQEVLRMTARESEKLEAKLKGLTERLERVKRKKRFLGSLLTEPDKPGRPEPMRCKKYLLCGIATPTDVIYLRQRCVSDLMEWEEVSEPSDQWWRLAYVPRDEPSVKTEKMDADAMLQEVWQVTKTPLLVYATEKALEAPRLPLTASLERFARAENKTFQNELNREKAEEAGDVPRSRQPGPISPSKRKHRADSVDSMDSNRASIGSDDLVGHPLDEEHGISALEMADMSEPLLGDKAEVDFDATDERTATLRATFTESTSATLTPSTLPAEDADGPVGQELERESEMQERSRPPVIVTARPPGRAVRGGDKDEMDMDLPSH
ncbi:hypothetical protein RJ55_05466 [Drechmeria coniospora]|nr:hypothetical protein RJ55_05466 [Drechmeria coniospora]